jgi:hypothetical protein
MPAATQSFRNSDSRLRTSRFLPRVGEQGLGLMGQEIGSEFHGEVRGDRIEKNKTSTVSVIAARHENRPD